MTSVYEVEEILLEPHLAPLLVGIARDSETLFVISVCCREKLQWDTGSLFWYCSNCENYARDRVGSGTSCVKAMPTENDPTAIVILGDMHAWVAAWTGLPVADFEVRADWPVR